MANPLMSRRKCRIAILGAVLGIITSAVPALAGDKVLPPTAKPHGYSLTDMAYITAYFNTGSRGGAPPQTPIKMLYYPADGNLTFTVRPGTMLYVPVLYSDDAPPVTGDLPDVTDKAAVANYYFNSHELGAQYIEIVVDGEATSLMEFGYPVGADTPLADSPGGHLYTTVAAFLTPLKPGTHSVTIRALFTGLAFEPGVFEFEVTFTVIGR